jgi:hypothetical protein
MADVKDIADFLVYNAKALDELNSKNPEIANAIKNVVRLLSNKYLGPGASITQSVAEDNFYGAPKFEFPKIFIEKLLSNDLELHAAKFLGSKTFDVFEKSVGYIKDYVVFDDFDRKRIGFIVEEIDFFGTGKPKKVTLKFENFEAFLFNNEDSAANDGCYAVEVSKNSKISIGDNFYLKIGYDKDRRFVYLIETLLMSIPFYLVKYNYTFNGVAKFKDVFMEVKNGHWVKTFNFSIYDESNFVSEFTLDTYQIMDFLVSKTCSITLNNEESKIVLDTGLRSFLLLKNGEIGADLSNLVGKTLQEDKFLFLNYNRPWRILEVTKNNSKNKEFKVQYNPSTTLRSFDLSDIVGTLNNSLRITQGRFLSMRYSDDTYLYDTIDYYKLASTVYNIPLTIPSQMESTLPLNSANYARLRNFGFNSDQRINYRFKTKKSKVTFGEFLRARTIWLTTEQGKIYFESEREFFNKIKEISNSRISFTDENGNENTASKDMFFTNYFTFLDWEPEYTPNNFDRVFSLFCFMPAIGIYEATLNPWSAFTNVIFSSRDKVFFSLKQITYELYSGAVMTVSSKSNNNDITREISLYELMLDTSYTNIDLLLNGSAFNNVKFVNFDEDFDFAMPDEDESALICYEAKYVLKTDNNNGLYAFMEIYNPDGSTQRLSDNYKLNWNALPKGSNFTKVIEKSAITRAYMKCVLFSTAIYYRGCYLAQNRRLFGEDYMQSYVAKLPNYNEKETVIDIPFEVIGIPSTRNYLRVKNEDVFGSTWVETTRVDLSTVEYIETCKNYYEKETGTVTTQTQTTTQTTAPLLNPSAFQFKQTIETEPEFLTRDYEIEPNTGDRPGPTQSAGDLWRETPATKQNELLATKFKGNDGMWYTIKLNKNNEARWSKVQK